MLASQEILGWGHQAKDDKSDALGSCLYIFSVPASKIFMKILKIFSYLKINFNIRWYVPRASSVLFTATWTAIYVSGTSSTDYMCWTAEEQIPDSMRRPWFSQAIQSEKAQYSGAEKAHSGCGRETRSACESSMTVSGVTSTRIPRGRWCLWGFIVRLCSQSLGGG